MKCIIQCVRPLKNKIEIITLSDDKLFYDDGRYEKLILNNRERVNELYSELYDIAFSWKHEYIGERIYDGEKYLIELDVNHKRRKYKIQNKFPNNWQEFLLLKKKILELCGELDGNIY